MATKSMSLASLASPRANAIDQHSADAGIEDRSSGTLSRYEVGCSHYSERPARTKRIGTVRYLTAHKVREITHRAGPSAQPCGPVGSSIPLMPPCCSQSLHRALGLTVPRCAVLAPGDNRMRYAERSGTGGSHPAMLQRVVHARIEWISSNLFRCPQHHAITLSYRGLRMLPMTSARHTARRSDVSDTWV